MLDALGLDPVFSVYVLYDEKHVAFYVGCTSNAGARLQQHRHGWEGKVGMIVAFQTRLPGVASEVEIMLRAELKRAGCPIQGDNRPYRHVHLTSASVARMLILEQAKADVRA